MKFEDRLLDELKTVVRTRAEERGGAHGTMRRRRRALAGGLGAAAAGAAGVAGVVSFTMVGPAASPAWSVEEGENGKVTVSIDKWQDLDGLERELGKYASHALVQVAPVGKACSSEWENALREIRPSEMGVEMQDPDSEDRTSGTLYLTFDLAQVPEDGTLVAYHVEHADSNTLGGDRLLVGDGQVESCELVPRAG